MQLPWRPQPRGQRLTLRASPRWVGMELGESATRALTRSHRPHRAQSRAQGLGLSVDAGEGDAERSASAARERQPGAGLSAQSCALCGTPSLCADGAPWAAPPGWRSALLQGRIGHLCAASVQGEAGSSWAVRRHGLGGGRASSFWSGFHCATEKPALRLLTSNPPPCLAHRAWSSQLKWWVQHVLPLGPDRPPGSLCTHHPDAPCAQGTSYSDSLKRGARSMAAGPPPALSRPKDTHGDAFSQTSLLRPT